MVCHQNGQLRSETAERYEADEPSDGGEPAQPPVTAADHSASRGQWQKTCKLLRRVPAALVCFFFAESNSEWRTIRGKFLAINAASMSCACPRSPKGLSPAAHLADGTTDLILVRKCTRFDFLRHLLRHTSKDDQVEPKLPFPVALEPQSMAGSEESLAGSPLRLVESHNPEKSGLKNTH